MKLYIGNRQWILIPDNKSLKKQRCAYFTPKITNYRFSIYDKFIPENIKKLYIGNRMWEENPKFGSRFIYRDS